MLNNVNINVNYLVYSKSMTEDEEFEDTAPPLPQSSRSVLPEEPALPARRRLQPLPPPVTTGRFCHINGRTAFLMLLE